jgi:hypothetical protein
MMDSPQLPETFIYIRIRRPSIRIGHFSMQIAKGYKEVIASPKRQRQEIVSQRLHIKHKNVPFSAMAAMHRIEASNGPKETTRRKEESLL